MSDLINQNEEETIKRLELIQEKNVSKLRYRDFSILTKIFLK